MIRKILLPILLFATLGISNAVTAEPLQLDKAATITSVLKNHINKRVILKLVSGEELTGTVKAVHAKLTHLNSLSGMEYFDAVVVNDQIAAVVLRVRDK